MGILLSINAINFAFIICKHCSAQMNRRKNNPESTDLQRIENSTKYMYIKLFSGMGLLWIFEIIGGLSNAREEYFYVVDILNMLQGFYIFIIHICNPNVINIIINSRRNGRQSARNDQETQPSLEINQSGDNQAHMSHWAQGPSGNWAIGHPGQRTPGPSCIRPIRLKRHGHLGFVLPAPGVQPVRHAGYLASGASSTQAIGHLGHWAPGPSGSWAFRHHLDHQVPRPSGTQSYRTSPRPYKLFVLSGKVALYYNDYYS